jgi:hypothetical protein
MAEVILSYASYTNRMRDSVSLSLPRKLRGHAGYQASPSNPGLYEAFY